MPAPLRLAHLTGLADLLNDAGKLTFSGNEGSLFARGDVTAAATWATGWLPVAVAAVLAAFLGLGFAAGQLRARACKETRDRWNRDRLCGARPNDSAGVVHVTY